MQSADMDGSGSGGPDTTQLLKGVLDLAVLAVVAERDSYGYDVLRRLRDSGLQGVGDASVYGTLRRLYQAGALTSYVVPSEEGPHRRYYGLTGTGRATLSRSLRAWRAVTGALDALLDGREAAR
jgi:PadR family transcriptional regulator, regulatory protein PadR